jgi:hypothetical protein
MTTDDADRKLTIGPFHIAICCAVLSVVGLVYLPDLVLFCVTFFLCGAIVLTLLGQLDDEYLFFAVPTGLPALLCSVAYLLISNPSSMDLEFDGSPKRYEATLRSYLMPERFYRGQLEIIDATVAQLKSTHVPGWKYAADYDAEMKRMAALVADATETIRNELAATSVPATTPAIAAMQAKALDAEAKRLHAIADQIRYTEFLASLAVVHDQKFQEELARYNDLRGRVIEKLRKI